MGQANADDNICTATFPVDSSYDLGHLFRGMAGLFGLDWADALHMRSMPLHHEARTTIDGDPLPEVWYKTEFTQAPGLRWALIDPVMLLHRRLQTWPYEGAHIEVQPARVLPAGECMTVLGWIVTVNLTMNPDTTLETIQRHRKLLVPCIVTGGKKYELKDNTGVLRMAFQPQI